jgi:hypothetical protein
MYVSVQEYRQVVIGSDIIRKRLTSEREQIREAKNRGLARILILSAFAKLRNATVSSVMSVCVPVRLVCLYRLPPDGFS